MEKKAKMEEKVSNALQNLINRKVNTTEGVEEKVNT